jgi:inorganic pyrophosphatase
MTALQSIIKEAKSLKKQYPKRYAKWTDYVKQASAIYASKHKGKSPVGKKRKVGAAKPVSKHKDTKSHNVNIRVVSGIKKKKATKKAVKKSTTLTKVKQVLKKDNVRLKHGYNLTSGKVKLGAVNSNIIDDYKKTCQNIKQLENDLLGFQNILKKYPNAPKNLKDATKKYIKTYKILIKEKKIHARELKKLI